VSALLYGEDAGRVVASCRPREAAAFRTLAEEHGVPIEPIGTVAAANETLEIHLRNNHTTLRWPTTDLRRAYFDAIPRRMQAEAGR
jgi:hypothetical protein